jgi:hypothetical protein
MTGRHARQCSSRVFCWSRTEVCERRVMVRRWNTTACFLTPYSPARLHACRNATKIFRCSQRQQHRHRRHRPQHHPHPRHRHQRLHHLLLARRMCYWSSSTIWARTILATRTTLSSPPQSTLWRLTAYGSRPVLCLPRVFSDARIDAHWPLQLAAGHLRKRKSRVQRSQHCVNTSAPGAQGRRGVP